MSEFTCGSCPCFQDVNLHKLVKKGLLKAGESWCDEKSQTVESADEVCILRRLMITDLEDAKKELEYLRKADEEILAALGDDAIADADELGLTWVWETAVHDIKRIMAERNNYKRILFMIKKYIEAGMVPSDSTEGKFYFSVLAKVRKVLLEVLPRDWCTECDGFGEIYDKHGTGVAPRPCPKCKPDEDCPICKVPHPCACDWAAEQKAKKVEK